MNEYDASLYCDNCDGPIDDEQHAIVDESDGVLWGMWCSEACLIESRATTERLS